MKGFNPTLQEIEELTQKARAGWRHINPDERNIGTLTPGPPTSNEPESVLQGKIVKWAKEHGFPIQSNRQTKQAKGLLTPGWPDICLILKERVVFIELKAGKGRMTEDQLNMRIRFLHLKHVIYECRTWRRFLEIVTTDKR